MSQPDAPEQELPEALAFQRWNRWLFLLIGPVLFWGGALLAHVVAARAVDAGGSYVAWYLPAMLLTIAVTVGVVWGVRRRFYVALVAAVERQDLGTGPELR